MAVTTNITITGAYTLLRTAAGKEVFSGCSLDRACEVVNHDSGTTAPAATLRGYPYKQGEVFSLPLVSGDHLWWRFRHDAADRTRSDAQGVSTVQSS